MVCNIVIYMSGHVSALYEFITHKRCHAQATEILPCYIHRVARVRGCLLPSGQRANSKPSFMYSLPQRNIAHIEHYIDLISPFINSDSVITVTKKSIWSQNIIFQICGAGIKSIQKKIPTRCVVFSLKYIRTFLNFTPIPQKICDN